MPNWVYNDLTFEGSHADIDRLTAWLREELVIETSHTNADGSQRNFIETFTGMSFHKVIPVPREIYGEYFSDCGHSPLGAFGQTPNNWYNWNLDHWGTKWDACNPNWDAFYVHNPDGSAKTSISFDTAWDAPMPIFDAIANMWPQLKITITYLEEQGWGGSLIFQDGVLVHSSYHDVPSNHYEAIDILHNCGCEDGYRIFNDCPVDEVELTPDSAHAILDLLGSSPVPTDSTNDSIEGMSDDDE